MAQIADGTAGVIVNASPATVQVAPRHSVALTPASRPRIVDLKLDSVRLLAILRREGIVTKADCV